MIPLSRNLKGVIFDLDGTLIHSLIDFPQMKRHIIRILEGNGVSKGILKANDTSVVILEKAERAWDETGKPESERVRVRVQLEDAMNQEERKAISNTEEVEDATEAIRRLKEMGYKLAVLTRSHHAYAVEALKKIGAYQYFDVVLGREETPKPKPYIEALEHAASLLNLSTDQILFVGDHPIDFASALNAKCSFVGVCTGPRGNASWEQERPENILDSVRDLPDYLAEQLRAATK